jgi:hypothetical protein
MAAAGGVAGGVAAALGSSSGESENIPRKVNNFICQILPKLDKNSIAKREMKLCEAYCLLWHHRRLGTVDGRKTSDKLISCAYASVILDLWAAGKIDIEVRGKLTDECVQAVIKVMMNVFKYQVIFRPYKCGWMKFQDFQGPAVIFKDVKFPGLFRLGQTLWSTD